MNDATPSLATAKAMAKALRSALEKRGHAFSHSECLEMVAVQFGFRDWNVLSARGSEPEGPVFDAPRPILRIFDVDRAKDFYVDFLGFDLDWEHRFGEQFPLYCQVSRAGLTIHLSEHSGDASPGAKVFVPMRGLDAFHAELQAKTYRYNRPGIEEQPWGRELQVTDPFSNRIAFVEPG